MENKYNYYEPEDTQIMDEEPEDTQIMDEEPEDTQITDEEPVVFEKKARGEEKKRSRRKLPVVAKTIALAVVFGLVAGTVGYGTDRVLNQVAGSDKSEVVLGSAVQSEDPKVSLTQSSNTVTSDVSGVVDKTMPAVVSITNMSVQEVMSFFGGVQERESMSCGSGIIIGKNDTELLVVTNNHVVANANTLTVSFVDDTAVEATIKGTEPAKDLAIIAIPLDSISEDTMSKIDIIAVGDSDALRVGEPVIAIGNALGYGQSVTTGIVSATGRELEGIDCPLIQTDAAINPGNSGGALLNANGELIGINCAKSSADMVEGMGYAIPITDATENIEGLMNRETRNKVSDEEKGYLGIQGVDVTEDSAIMYNMPIGVYIAEVIDGSGAQKAGISKGSVITKFDGVTIDCMKTLQNQLQYYRIGEEVEVEVQVPSESGEYNAQTIVVVLGKQSQ